ncbi:MAG TPA: protein-glutamine glutaminase family protein, partial [Chitinophagaceae bacterium]|nr:protein-glutamine glutaminase family protein [Chitinophagaceae bacterium]
MSPAYFPNAELSYLKIYDIDAIQQAFDSIAHNSQIEFNFPQGGCQQRAQIMSILLDKKFRIDHCKVWLFPPVALYIGDARTLFIEDMNGLTPGNRIEWNYHVAPVVQVRRGNEVMTMVIDPSINSNAPLLLNEWFALIGNSSVSKYSFLLPDKYFFYCCYASNNTLTTIFDGNFFNYENAMKDDLTMEKGLAVNDMAMRIFHKYIQPLTVSENEADATKLKDLKEIFGNTTSLDMIFSQNISGYSLNTKLRYVMTHYSAIMDEARNIL